MEQQRVRRVKALDIESAKLAEACCQALEQLAQLEELEGKTQMAEWWRSRSRAVYESPVPDIELVAQVATGLRDLGDRILYERSDLTDVLRFMAVWIVDRAQYRRRQHGST